MDSLTHGLLGVAVAALRRPDAQRGERWSATDRATLLASVLAAELPDLDYLWPAADPVLHTLRSHRGVTHSLLAAPLVALVATGIAKLFFRKARARAVFPFALLSVAFAHLLADAWTGWGTRLFLPFSDARVTLDWMMVVDPFFTLPLLGGLLLALYRRERFRHWLLAGAGAALAYLGLRVGLQAHAESALRDDYPEAAELAVFPRLLGVTRFRYVAALEREFAVGEVGVFSEPIEQARHPRSDSHAGRQKALARRVPTLAAALDWARFAIVDEHALPGGGRGIAVADLRYHWRGAPTLTFVIELDERERTTRAFLDRGGTARSFIERLRD